MTILDCGCGAGRFVHLAAERGAGVAGIDAAAELVEIAASRTPQADLHVGDFEALPWPDGSFDVVTGFSTFQFADDHVRALGEARRVSRGPVWVVIPTRLAESRRSSRHSWPCSRRSCYRRSGEAECSPSPHRERSTRHSTPPDYGWGRDDTLDATVVFPDQPAAVAAFLSAGTTTLALQHFDLSAVEKAVHDGLDPFVGDHGQVTLPGWFHVVESS
jgi:SAM-dependent methyltransferase